MKLSKYPFKSQKESSNKSFDRMIRAGYIYQVSSGIFSYNNLAVRSLNKINNLIRKYMDPLGYETILPILQPMSLWQESGRENVYGPNMFKLSDRHDVPLCLSPTAEEATLKLGEFFCDSKSQFPYSLYQIGKKFRDEIRPRAGIIRGRAFHMKDAYSFSLSKECAMEQYRLYIDAYLKFFKELNLKIYVTKAGCGEIGGELSHEFSIESDYGNDQIEVVANPNYTVDQIMSNQCFYGPKTTKKVLEVAQTYYLGDKYSKKMKMKAPGEVMMGCYGIGVSRVLSVLMEAPYLNPIISPFKYFAIDLNNKYIDYLENNLSDILIDDRKVSFGCSKNDSEIIGIPYVLIIGKNFEFHDYYNDKHMNFENIEDLVSYANSYK